MGIVVDVAIVIEVYEFMPRRLSKNQAYGYNEQQRGGNDRRWATLRGLARSVGGLIHGRINR